MLNDETLRIHFNKCFPERNNSNFRKYVEILKNRSLKPKTDNKSTKRKQNEEDNLNIGNGYRKWKIIPRMYFKSENLDQEISNNRENIVFMKPEHYVTSSYLLMLYFHDIGNEILESFLYRRLQDILKRKNTNKNTEDRVEYLKSRNNRKYILHKIRNRKNITKEDYETIRKIFEK